MASNTTHPKRSAAGATEHEPHYSTDDDALAGRANDGSTTPARGSGQTRYESLNDRIKQMLREDPILRQLLDELLGDE